MRWAAVAALVAGIAAGEARAAADDGLGAAAVRLHGTVDSAEAGYDAVSVGDLDGDGADELLVGAPFGDFGRGSQGGAAYLFYGPVDEAGPLSSADVVFLGGRPGDFAAEDVGAVGDLDGDGFDELLVGTPGSIPAAQAGDPRPGEAYLFYGSRQRRSGTVLLQPDCIDARVCDAGFTGAHPTDFAGFGLPKHPVGDVDGDGRQDLLIGSAGFGAFGGAAYLFYGEGARFEGTTSLADANAIFVAAPGRIATNPMTGVGDLDGDGFADFAIGAASWFPAAALPGEVYVYYGGGTRRAGVTPMAAADAVLIGAQPGDRTGDGLAGGADVDADGLSDLLVGSPGPDGEATGTAYLVYGAKQRLAGPLPLAELADAAAFNGVEGGDAAGEGVASGDLDGDGFADVAVGAPEAGDGGTVYVLPGGPRRVGPLPLAQAERRFVAEEAGDAAGSALATGRFAGGRAGQLAVMAPTRESGRGAAYVLRSPGAIADPAPPVTGPGRARAVPRIRAAARRSRRLTVIQGRLVLPRGISPKRACTGRVAAVAQRGSKVLGRGAVTLRGRCTFRLRLRARGRGLRAMISFSGNSILAPRAVRVRVR